MTYYLKIEVISNWDYQPFQYDERNYNYKTYEILINLLN